MPRSVCYEDQRGLKVLTYEQLTQTTPDGVKNKKQFSTLFHQRSVIKYIHKTRIYIYIIILYFYNNKKKMNRTHHVKCTSVEKL